MTAEIVKWAASRTKDVEKDDGVAPAATSHVISCLDLLSAHYDGLAAAAAPYAAKYHLLEHLHATLIADAFDERVGFYDDKSLYSSGSPRPHRLEYVDRGRRGCDRACSTMRPKIAAFPWEDPGPV